MRDFPMFSTSNGVASLVLSQIPYSGIAYITIRASQTPDLLLSECVEFCVAAGAEKIYATGDPCLQAYPEHTRILQMRCETANIEQSDCALFPATEKTLEQWRRIYNEKMADVPNASYMSIAAAQKRLQDGGMYFVHRSGMLLGIGLIDGNEIEAVASAVPGSGREIMAALAHATFADSVQLKVAATNHRAMRLYRTMGFIPVAEISVWYRVK